MKSCAKQRGVSTAALLRKVKGEEEAGFTAGVKRQVNLKTVLRATDEDFKEAPPTLVSRTGRTRKRKKPASEESVEYL